jgi:1-acyl-sn-glycerol-3-phosphate acyltransferase
MKVTIAKPSRGTSRGGFSAPGAILPPVRPSLPYLLIGFASWPVLSGLFRLRAVGQKHLPESQGFVLAANHLSNLDPWALGLPLFPQRWLRFMAKSELYWWPLGALLRVGGAFPVRRGEGDLEAIETAIRLCREGQIVVMFPEGTRSKKGLAKKHRPRPHTGAARIALAATVPLVPAAIKGTERLARLGPIRVAYGAPVALDDLRDRPLTDGAHVATGRLMNAIERLHEGLGSDR